MDKVILYFNSTLGHFSQLITGLQYLKENKKIDLTYKLELNKYPIDLFKIQYNELLIFVDMSDNSDFNHEIYEQCDFYIKRMLLVSDFDKYPKLIPYGLNYQIYNNNNFAKFAFLKNRKLLKYSMRYSTTLSTILNIKDCIVNNNLSNMNSLPMDSNKILFRARLWDPENNHIEWKKKEREILNNERISINRKMKILYGEGFAGGIQKDACSLKECPDLLLLDGEYHKRNYLKLLQSCSIGIVNQGLEDSITWKMGEYVSHSMAIISNPIEKYKLLGPFQENVNYLSYNNLSECLIKTELLYSSNSVRKDMQEANRSYYNDYLHPGVKLSRIFSLIENRSNN